jgi:F-type H+-transporting ATPase subunit b
MELNWSTLVLQTINFAVLVWLLQRFLYKPVLRMIDARKADIERQYENAKAVEFKTKARLAEVEAERANIAADREAALKGAAAEAQEAAKARRAEAEREARALLDDARKAIAAERERALAEARRAVIDLGAEFAQRLLTAVPAPFPMAEWIAPFRADAWIARIEKYLRALPRQELGALARQLAENSELTVVTASPLPLDAAAAWRKRLCGLLGEDTSVAFEVNPELIAGAELHFPAAVLRFSWQGALAALRSEALGDANAR